jgi:hypothetical protein
MPWKPKTRADWIPRDTPDDVAITLFIERTKKLTDVTLDGCWIYTGPKNLKGYGQASFRGKRHTLHRLIYELHHGAIPKGHLICHKCDRPACWNPDHLWAGTPKQNSLDMPRKGRQRYQDATHCTSGHEFTPENIAWLHREGRPIRTCRMCQRVRQRIVAGWPKELAESMPPTPKGHRPVGAKFPRKSTAVGKSVEDGK